MFTPSRLRLARKRHGLTKTRLAEAVGVDLRTVSGYENGEWPPPPDMVEKLAECLRFPVEFFSDADAEEPSPETASFRAMSRMSAAKRDAALSTGAIAFLLNDWLEERFEFPAVDLPELRDDAPEAAAAGLRHQWALGERPIRNMVHLLESKGVRVFSLAEDTVDVDAFSLWRGNTPFVFLNTLKSAEHGRFDAAHELGHLVLHRHGGPHRPNAEREADAFASAFLMPRASVLAVAPRTPTLTYLIQLKKHWIVSVAALVYRLHSVGLLSEWHYRTLCIQMSERGFRKREPEGAPRETSVVLAKVFAALREERVTYEGVASELHLDSGEVQRLIFQLVLLGVPGGAIASARHRLPKLKLVE
jgi:Zn-dependent peptidase ImmA (M78 family)/DNA-binding XRE family transcriptional regulator